MFKIFFAIGKIMVDVIVQIFTAHFINLMRASWNLAEDAVAHTKQDMADKIVSSETIDEELDIFANALGLFKNSWKEVFETEAKSMLSHIMVSLAMFLTKNKDNPDYVKDIAKSVNIKSAKKRLSARSRRPR